MQNNFMEYLHRFIGKPYIYASNCPVIGVDCSGLICEGLRSVGLIGKEDYSAQGLYDLFRKYPNEQVFGSLLFFGKSLSEISHVAAYIADGLMIEAGGGDQTTINIEEAVKRNAYVRIRPVSNRSDLILSKKIFSSKG